MHLLLIEDAPGIRSFLVTGLTEEGFQVSTASDLEQARQHLRADSFDLLIIDRMLPDGDGLDLIRELRRRNNPTPVLCLTARDQVNERVEGLRCGADDYLIKPFAFDELLARILAITRRGSVGEFFEVGQLRIDVLGHRVTQDGRPVELTQREFALLLALIRSAGRVVSRARLLEQVWDMQFDPGTNRVDVYVRYLRRKLGDQLIKTVRGVGYMIAPSSPDA